MANLVYQPIPYANTIRIPRVCNDVFDVFVSCGTLERSEMVRVEEGV